MKKLIIIISMLFSVAYGQTCDTVTNLTFSLITTSTARVTWTHATNKISYNWALYCLSGCGGTAQQTGTTAGNTLNLSGLNSSFAYQFCITTYCGATSSAPKCSNFTTLSPQIQYTPMTAAGYQFKYVKVDTGFNIPFQDTSLKRGTTRPGALVCNTADSNVYSYNGNYWELLQGVNSSANKVDSVIINSAGDSLFYWINGTSYGQVFGGASSRWSILGNSGTNPASNFLGTIDSVRLDLRTNNTIRQSITGSGNVGIGTVNPTAKLYVVGDMSQYNQFGNGITTSRKNTILGNWNNVGSNETVLSLNDSIGHASLSSSVVGGIKVGIEATPISTFHVSGTIRGTDSLILSGLPSGVGTKALRINPSTGIVTYADTTAGGGGSQTWQQTLTSGSTLTGNNTIDGGGYNFKMNGTGFFSGRYDGTSTVTLANGGIAFGRSVDGKLTATGDGTAVIGYTQDNNAEISGTGSGSLTIGYANDGSKILNTANGSFVGGMAYHTGSLLKTSAEGSFVWGGISSGSIGIDTISNIGYESVVFGHGKDAGVSNLINEGNRAFVFGGGYTNSFSNVFTYGVGSQQFLIDGATGNIGIGTSTPTVALDVVGAIKNTDSVSFTGLLPKSASTDSVVVKDINGKLGTTAKSAFGSTYSAGYGLSLASTTFSADSSVLMTKGTTQVVSGIKYHTADNYFTSKVGVGTNAPTTKIQVNSGTDLKVFSLGSSATGSYVEKFHIDSTGQVMIGTTPSYNPGLGYASLVVGRNGSGTTGILFDNTNGLADKGFITNGDKYLMFGRYNSGGTYTESAYLDIRNSTLSIGTGAIATVGLHVRKTTEQLRLDYNASNYYSTTVQSTGAVAFDAIGAGSQFSFADNVGIGTTAPDSALTVNTSANIKTNLRVQGTITLTDGANKSVGVSGAMTAGTITISNIRVTANSRIFLTHATVGGTQGILSVGTITAGTSFVINSSSVLDTGTVNWFIIN